MKKISYFLFLFLTTNVQVIGQVVGRMYGSSSEFPLAIPTPNASSLFTFRDIPVDYRTGIPDISIPLYTVTSKSIQIPIILKYHSSGIKPNIYPGWVGQNWTLQAGGEICRVVKGIPDENDNYIPMYTGTLFKGYFYNYSMFAPDDWYTFSYFDPLKDNEPDEFNFNVNGLCGTFFLDHLGNWQVKSEQEIKVVFDSTEDIQSINFDYYYYSSEDKDTTYRTPFSHGKMFTKFTLLGPDGTIYVFGGNIKSFGKSRNSIEFTRHETPEILQIPIATSWHLTKVISPDRSDSIVLNYVRGRDDLILTYTTPYGVEIETYSNNSTPIISRNPGAHILTNLLEPSYLESIYCRNQKLIFNSSKSDSSKRIVVPEKVKKYRIHTVYGRYMDLGAHTNGGAYSKDKLYQIGRKLDNIEIIDSLQNPSQIIKKIDFQFIENLNESLKLEKISIYDPNYVNIKKVYNLTYYRGEGYVSIPSYDTKKIDHWGYFNNTNPDSLLLTSDADDLLSLFENKDLQEAYFNSRNASLDSLVYLSDMLKEIKYPTGGYTRYEFEPNSFSSHIFRFPYVIEGKIGGVFTIDEVYDSVNIPSGGLRIKRMKHFDTSDNLVESKTYYYVKNFEWNDNETSIKSKLSSGISNTPIVYDGDTLCRQEYTDCLLEKEKCIDSCFIYHNDPDLFNECISYCPTCEGLNNCAEYFNPYFKKACFIALDGSISGCYLKFSDFPYITFYHSDGENVIYSEVVERNKNNSYTKYTYDYGDTPEILPLGSVNNNYFCEMTSLSSEYHKLSKVENFSDIGTKIKEVNYTYTNDLTRFNKGIRIISHNVESYAIDYESSYYSFNYGSSSSRLCGTAILKYYYNYYISKIEEKLFTNTGTITTETHFNYEDNVSDRLLKLKRCSTSNDNGCKYQETQYTYPKHIVSGVLNYLPAGNIYKRLDEFNIQTPVEIIEKTRTNSNSTYITNATLTKFEEPYTNIIKPSIVYEMENTAPIPEQSFTYCNLDMNGNFYYDNRYKERFKFSYDTFGNIIESTYNQIKYSCELWGYNYLHPIAVIMNAKIQECGYSGFENEESNSFEIPNSSNAIFVTDAFTGRKALQITNSYGPSNSFIVGKNAENHVGYKASVWVKGSTSAYIHMQINDIWATRSRVANTDTGDGWHLLEVEIPRLKIEPYFDDNLFIKVYIGNENSTAAIFDDLRFYPMDAEMNTYTYDPVIGMTSSSDANNKPNNYMYDPFGRLSVIKDYQGNILKKFEYHYTSE